MSQKLKALFLKYYDVITYLVFGVLTTLVNCLVYYPCLNYFALPASVSSVIAWFFAVAFAYLTNKPFVFKSKDWSAETVIPELIQFVGCRVGSGALETGILFVAVDMFHWDGNLWKIITSIFVVIINYAASKLLVFRRKK